MRIDRKQHTHSLIAVYLTGGLVVSAVVLWSLGPVRCSFHMAKWLLYASSGSELFYNGLSQIYSSKSHVQDSLYYCIHVYVIILVCSR